VKLTEITNLVSPQKEKHVSPLKEKNSCVKLQTFATFIKKAESSPDKTDVENFVEDLIMGIEVQLQLNEAQPSQSPDLPISRKEISQKQLPLPI
jgi:hypothetical protein